MAEKTTPKQRKPESWPLPWMAPFLAALRNSANVRASCQAADVSRQMAYKARKSSAKFRDAWDDCVDDALDVLEAVAFQRARESSDFLLWRLLTSRRPNVYGDRLKVETDWTREAERIAQEYGLPPEKAGTLVSMAEHMRARRTGTD